MLRPPGDKTDQGEGSKAIELLTSDGGRKRKRPCFTEEEVLVMTNNMTDAVNNVANALRETGPAYIDVDMSMLSWTLQGSPKKPSLLCFPTSWTKRHMPQLM